MALATIKVTPRVYSVIGKTWADQGDLARHTWTSLRTDLGWWEADQEMRVVEKHNSLFMSAVRAEDTSAFMTNKVWLQVQLNGTAQDGTKKVRSAIEVVNGEALFPKSQLELSNCVNNYMWTVLAKIHVDTSKAGKLFYVIESAKLYNPVLRTEKIQEPLVVPKDLSAL